VTFAGGQAVLAFAQNETIFAVSEWWVHLYETCRRLGISFYDLDFFCSFIGYDLFSYNTKTGEQTSSDPRKQWNRFMPWQHRLLMCGCAYALEFCAFMSDLRQFPFVIRRNVLVR